MGQLYAITPFTQLDYPGELACIAWFSGCNLRCVYCHNPNIVLNRGQKDDRDLIAFLEKRQGLLTGVVFSGGEATFCASLPKLVRQAKTLGYKTKLDTNGTHPAMLRELVSARILDAIALDYKCPPSGTKKLLGTTYYETAFYESLSYLIEESHRDNIQLEIRTTCHPSYVSTQDVAWIIDDLDQRHYQGTYWLQNIVATDENTLGNIGVPPHPLNIQELPSPKNFTLGSRNFFPPVSGDIH